MGSKKSTFTPEAPISFEGKQAANWLMSVDPEILRLAQVWKEDGGSAICMMTIGGRLLDLLGVIEDES